VIVTGIMWAYVDIVPKNNLRPHVRDIRAVHFGSIYLVAWLLGLAYAFDRLGVPAFHWWFFPAGLGLLVTFSSIAYMFPKPPDLDPFYYWTRGWPMILAGIGMASMAVCLAWTATVLTIYALRFAGWA
ncbi:MAG TPA: hypothetical protein VFW87_26230, partial [Pirellulales bacterium]|nr:hypothetical protein [Pirellulales bacterium]